MPRSKESARMMRHSKIQELTSHSNPAVRTTAKAILDNDIGHLEEIVEEPNVNRFQQQEAEIAQLQRHISQLQKRDFLQPFINDLKDQVVEEWLMETKYSGWPQMAKTSLEEAAKNHDEDTVKLFLRILPQ